MTSLRSLKPLLVALAALSVSACVSILPETEPSAIYRLSSPTPVEWSGRERMFVEINTPLAPRGLAGDEIALLMDGRHLAYMASAKWIAPAPRIVQNLVIDTFNATSASLAPARPEDGVRADYELRLDLREFEAAYDQGAGRAPMIHVSLTARMIATDGRRLIGTQVFSSQMRASANREGAIIDAFDGASRIAIRDLADWTIEVAGQ